MKKFMLGFLVGAILFSLAPVSAAIEEFICYRADYKVIINGEEYISEELPILNYKGNTYAPFRSILEKAGLDVNWNAELGQAEVTSNPTDAQNNTEEGNTVSVEYDLNTKLPIGAEYIEYKGCNKAVSYNGNIYISRGDLSSKFGIDSIYIDVKTHSTIFVKGDKSITIDYELGNARILNLSGTAYYNASLLSELIGE